MDKSDSLVIRKDYELNRVDYLTDVESGLIAKAKELLSLIKKSDIKELDLERKFKTLKDVVSSFSAIHAAGRLEKGQSTENVAVIVQAIKEAKKRKKEGITDAV
jgi:hypothetical protein